MHIYIICMYIMCVYMCVYTHIYIYLHISIHFGLDGVMLQKLRSQNPKQRMPLNSLVAERFSVPRSDVRPVQHCEVGRLQGHAVLPIKGPRIERYLGPNMEL